MWGCFGKPRDSSVGQRRNLWIIWTTKRGRSHERNPVNCPRFCSSLERRDSLKPSQLSLGLHDLKYKTLIRARMWSQFFSKGPFIPDTIFNSGSSINLHEDTQKERQNLTPVEVEVIHEIYSHETKDQGSHHRAIQGESNV